VGYFPKVSFVLTRQMYTHTHTHGGSLHSIRFNENPQNQTNKSIS